MQEKKESGMAVSGAWFDNGAISLERNRKNQLICLGLFAFVVSKTHRRQVEMRVWSSRKAELQEKGSAESVDEFTQTPGSMGRRHERHGLSQS